MDAAAARVRVRLRSVEIEIARRLRDWLLARLLERLFEPFRQRIPARLLRRDRLLEDRLAARRFLREDPLGIAQLGPDAPLRLLMTNDTSQVHVDDELRLATRARNVELGLQSHDSNQLSLSTPHRGSRERVAYDIPMRLAAAPPVFLATLFRPPAPAAR